MVQLPAIPPRIFVLPRDDRGFPVPFFVHWEGGKPLFPVMDPAKLARAIRERRCWVCGEQLARRMTFVIGPMCAVNRVSAEPPSHLECAEFSARACPFLSRPNMRRMEVSECPTRDMPGIAILRNPGVTCLWSTRSYTPFRAPGGHLFRIGPPERVTWWAEGRAATREEVTASMESGLPTLLDIAKKQCHAAVTELERMTAVAMQLIPAHEAVAAAAV